ncbi:3-methyl-2-oxobutanoate dehydrogenase (2-methylpropanoyl-transferring) subunit alpha [Pelagibacterium luteolum]|uniref:2-oxoisovalerate dehydrogenase subunit alpha n=1 Tax=Pelagibacterium luteolum TaxID=440168 RepID=A0A1G7WI03_9HYPH|nr:3-methyl-2-oxobutanoate dehydrogenase (2-methylpropanoyl-transferring) subunit alpha [Pelagibacterium luteolum]SDG71538.1 2-oxoisovalerate dehydrogenase E1 component alpha subunit [Pelagibacterium luteolum]
MDVSARRHKTNREPLALHVPEPPARPGDPVDFSHIAIPEAGAMRCPDIAEPEPGMRDLPYGLIRVLDDEGRAVGPWDPRLDPDTLRAGLRAMLKTRLFDDRMFRAHRQGKTSFYMKSLGEEAIGAAQAIALDNGDMNFPTYRMLAWLMARDYPLIDLCNQIYSNERDPLRGRQLPILYSARDYGFYSLSGNLGSRFGHAVGWAMASAYSGDDRIAIGHVGDGTTAEGDFHEALTFAAVYKAPVILCVENNQWAISSFSGIAGAGETTFAAKAIAYGIPGLRVDGNDFLAVYAATLWAADRARANHGPTLIEFFTYRAAGHSTSDDPTRYRPADEAAHWPLGDPLDRLKTHLIALGEWSEDQHDALSAQITADIKSAVKQAESIGTLGTSKPNVREMFEDVFAEPDWRIIEQRREAGV